MHVSVEESLLQYVLSTLSFEIKLLYCLLERSSANQLAKLFYSSERDDPSPNLMQCVWNMHRTGVYSYSCMSRNHSKKWQSAAIRLIPTMSPRLKNGSAQCFFISKSGFYLWTIIKDALSLCTTEFLKSSYVPLKKVFFNCEPFYQLWCSQNFQTLVQKTLVRSIIGYIFTFKKSLAIFMGDYKVPLIIIPFLFKNSLRYLLLTLQFTYVCLIK
jgi:hypothetical protein